MGHPQVENSTGFVLEPVFLADAEGRPLLVPTLKATFDLGPKGLVPAKEQEPLRPEGEPHGKPGESSDRFEPVSPNPANSQEAQLRLLPRCRALKPLGCLA